MRARILLFIIVAICAIFIVFWRTTTIYSHVISGGADSIADELYDIISSDKYCKLPKNKRTRPLIDAKMEIFSRHHIFGAPTRKCVDAITRYLNKHKVNVLSLGAGVGAVEYLIARGLEGALYATDIGIENTPRRNKKYKQWYPVDKLDYNDRAALLEYVSDKKIGAVLLSWPEMKFTSEPLKAIMPKYVIYIGEGPGGCTGSDELFEYFSLMKEIKMPYCSWGSMQDYCSIYVRTKE